ncbi:MAG TPA: hypothetical protein PKA20_02800 [Burkholderiaceae bacterium]|nr:hypothetical protein [Burkholderiaceae bacterium]
MEQRPRQSPTFLSRASLTSLLLTIVLSGCASTLSTQVTAFHPPEVSRQSLAGKTFVVLPVAGQAVGPEFDTYAASVRTALIDKGLVAAGEPAAELRVRLAYSVGPGSSAGAAGSAAGVSVGSGFGVGGGGGVLLGLGFPIATGGGGINYRRDLRVTIERAAAPGSSEPTRLYEAIATSEGRDPSLAPVMPAMVQALFDEFPSPNGQTRVVKVPAP